MDTDTVEAMWVGTMTQEVGKEQERKKGGGIQDEFPKNTYI